MLGFKIKNGITKAILRDSFNDIMPQSILERTDKKGFTTPESIWLRGCLNEYLNMNNLQNLAPYFHLEKVSKIFNEFKDGDDSQSHIIWRIISINQWLKMNNL